MAVATATISVYSYPTGVSNDQRMEILRGTIAISTGGTYPPGGFSLDWTGIEAVKANPGRRLHANQHWFPGPDRCRCQIGPESPVGIRLHLGQCGR